MKVVSNSTQILTSSFFGTTTIGARQSVGCSTLTITPASSILQPFLCFVNQWQGYPSWDVDSERLVIVIESNFVKVFHIAKTMKEIWIFSTIVNRALDQMLIKFSSSIAVFPSNAFDDIDVLCGGFIFPLKDGCEHAHNW